MTIIWLTGNTGAGKTTIAHQMQRLLRNSINLDGDEMRGVWQDLGLSLEDRLEQNLRVARLAKIMEPQTDCVIVSVIAPTVEIRGLAHQVCQPLWIHIDDGSTPTSEKPYQIPFHPYMRIKPDHFEGKIAAEEILGKLASEGLIPGFDSQGLQSPIEGQEVRK